MASPSVTPNKKRCVVCGEEKGRTAFIKDGDLCTKCRNTETNPLCLRRGSASTWSSVSPGPSTPRVVSSVRPDQYMGSGSPNRLPTASQSSSSIRNSPPILQYSYSQLPSSPHSEESNLSAKPSTNIVTLEHKIDLILESALEMERNQIQVAAIRAEMHKFLVELSHLNNNVAVEDDEKYSGLEALTVTIEQRFLSTRREISTLQDTISSLRSEIRQDSEALEETMRVETARREQIWLDRVTEERKFWNERILEERKQWQQSLEQQNALLQKTLQEEISQLRQESPRLAVIQNHSSNTPKIINQLALPKTQESLSQSKVPDLATGSVGLNSLSTQPPSSQSLGKSGNTVTLSLIGVKPKPPNIVIKRAVVKM